MVSWKLHHWNLPSVSTPTPLLIYWQLPLPLKYSYGKEVVDGGITCDGIQILNPSLPLQSINVSLSIATDVATPIVYYLICCHHHGPRLSLFHDRQSGHVKLQENTHTTMLHSFFLTHIAFMTPFLWHDPSFRYVRDSFLIIRMLCCISGPFILSTSL